MKNWSYHYYAGLTDNLSHEMNLYEGSKLDKKLLEAFEQIGSYEFKTVTLSLG